MVRRHYVRSGMKRSIYSSIARDISVAKKVVKFVNDLPKMDAEIAEDDPTYFTVWVYGDEWDFRVKNGRIYHDDEYDDDSSYTQNEFYNWALDSFGEEEDEDDYVY